MKRREFSQNEHEASEIVPVVDVPVDEVDCATWRIVCDCCRGGCLDGLKRMVEEVPALIHFSHHDRKKFYGIGRSPTLCHAAVSIYSVKDTSVLEYLISCGVNLNARDHRGRTPLHDAIAHHCRLEFSKCLVENGAEINAVDNFGSTPLHFAAGSIAESSEYMNTDDYQRAFDFLVAQGADIHARNHDGKTPLDILKNGKSSY